MPLEDNAPSGRATIAAAAIKILSDGQPRTGREIATELQRRGVEVDKSTVNSVLFKEGRQYIAYDPSTYSYTLVATPPRLDTLEPALKRSVGAGNGRSAKGAQSAVNIRVRSPKTAAVREHKPIDAPANPHSSTDLLEGMYVRVPYGEEPRPDEEYRDYQIGQVAGINDVSRTAVVRLLVPSPGEAARFVDVERRLEQLLRCFILPDTEFTQARAGAHGRILWRCIDKFRSHEYARYYVRLDGKTTELPEHDMIILSTRQSPDPLEQMRNYEFQNTIWRPLRNQAVESYYELRNATQGIDDLVGSRIMLLAHQAEVVARVLSDPECRYMLADEVGLGKTIEASIIMKGLSRRYPYMRTLIVAPASLVQQWHNELSTKFWLDFTMIGPANVLEIERPRPDLRSRSGVIVAAEHLARDSGIWAWINSQKWGLLIADEVHNIPSNPVLYNRICVLSAGTPRVLALSATPIQRRVEEYLQLLRMMDPVRYGSMDQATFRHIVNMQESIRKVISYLTPNLNEEMFDPEEFEEKMSSLVNGLDDPLLSELIERVRTSALDPDLGLAIARDAIAHVSENYRVEGRVIRNRRAHLQVDLPVRAVDLQYAYRPSEAERAALESLYDYLEFYTDRVTAGPVRSEYCRLLLHAAASSPQALGVLLEARLARLRAPGAGPALANSDIAALTTLAPPREEHERMRGLVFAAPVASYEVEQLEGALHALAVWREWSDAVVERASRRNAIIPTGSGHRLLQVLRAIGAAVGGQSTKVLLFSAWPQTLDLLKEAVERSLGKPAVAQFHSRMPMDELQAEADRFQADEACHVLLCDELGGEGRNFQIADLIIHVDLPWTPSQIEQRIGRVDRLGRTGTVLSVVPFALETPEDDLFGIWQDAFELFTHSMSGLEIALEGVQNELADAIATSIRRGLADILPIMQANVHQLREAVEDDRYFEEGAVNRRRRDEFQATAEKYRDGHLLGKALVQWSNLAGLRCFHDSRTDTVLYDPKQFNLVSMMNAKFFNPPNMEEALRRSGRMRNLVIRGTFNRDIAIRREDLVFLAPGDDPWTDAIIANAIEADRGRCCAARLVVPELMESWQGFEFLYSLTVDPRPLYAAGFDPVHLFRAQGFLEISSYRLVMASDGAVLTPTHQVWRILKNINPYHKPEHLGQRSGFPSKLQLFRERYPIEQWTSMLQMVSTAAREHIEAELEFAADLASEAQQQFNNRIAGWRAARRWLLRGTAANGHAEDIDLYAQISTALVAGIAKPVCQLESACFWVLESGATT